MTLEDQAIRHAEALHHSILVQRRKLRTDSRYMRLATHVRIHPDDWLILRVAAATVGADFQVDSEHPRIWHLFVEEDPSAKDGPIVEWRDERTDARAPARG